MLYQFSRAILDAHAPEAESDELRAAAAPSNQQIINAAKAAYSQFQPAVDAMTIALVNIINTGSQLQAITDLDSLNWLSRGIGPSVVDPIYASHDAQSAIAAARTEPALKSFSVGAFSNTLPGGNVGTIGFDRDLAGSATTGTMLTLDLFKNTVTTSLGSNLQFGVWTNPASELHSAVIGLYVATSVQGLAINLKMLLSPDLAPYGFVVSSGATVNLPVNSAVFAGATAIWP